MGRNAKKKTSGIKTSVKILWRVFFIGIFLGVLLIVAADFGLLGKMPSIEELQNPSASLASQVFADDGTLMGKYLIQDRINVKYADISKYAVEALVATEDERFYEHSGIDPKSVARAVFLLGSQGGGSTITMQTAKNLFTSNWQNSSIFTRIPQKIKEGIIAIKLERNFTKEEIITLYLNTVPFSDNIYGIRNAAKTFFQKEPDRLTIEEAATLIGMVNAPTAYNPRLYPARAKERRDFIINKMVNSNFITQTQASALTAKPIDISRYKKLNENTGLAPYFRMVLGEEMKRWCKTHTKPNGENYNLYLDGLKIYTTINPKMQIYAEEAVAKHMAYMQKILNSQRDIKTGSVWKGHENVLEAAMKASDRWRNLKEAGLSEADIRKSFQEKTNMKVFAWNNNREKDTVMTPYDSIKYSRQMLECGFMSMDPLSGHIKAWVGGIDFKNFKFDHVNINTRRQVGSTIKPLLYSLAIEEAGFTPNTMVVDQQQSFGQYGMVPATAASCTGNTMPMMSALTWSRNCATAYIMKQLGGDKDNQGAQRFVSFLKNCNVKAKIDPYPSIALGSCEISLYEMLQAYSMFPGRGFNVQPMYITRIEDKNGNVLETRTSQRKEVISDVTAYFVISMMENVVKAGTGRRMWSYGVSGSIAGKTGTTNDNSDAWFIGYTPQLLCGVWSGCDDRFIRFSSTTNGQGASAALPVWGYFYNKVEKDKTLPYSDTAGFAKPDVNLNEPSYDYINNSQMDLGAQGDNTGTGQSSDYEQGYDNTNPESIAPESNTEGLYDNEKSPTGEEVNPVNDKTKNAPGKNNPANKPPADTGRPKAVMPKKPQ